MTDGPTGSGSALLPVCALKGMKGQPGCLNLDRPACCHGPRRQWQTVCGAQGKRMAGGRSKFGRRMTFGSSKFVARLTEDQRNKEQRLSAMTFDEASMPRWCPCLASHHQQLNAHLGSLHPLDRSTGSAASACLPACVPRATTSAIGYRPKPQPSLLASYAATPSSSSMAQDDTAPTATTDPTTSPVAAASTEAPAADGGMPPTEEQYFEVCSSCTCRGIRFDRSMRAQHADI